MKKTTIHLTSRFDILIGIGIGINHLVAIAIHYIY
jgi:hypothetical protein